MSARVSNRASPASAAVAISLMAVFPGTRCLAETKAAETAASNPASAPVTLAPSTPELFFPPPPARAPGPTYAPADTPARPSPSAPSSSSSSGSAPASGSESGSGTAAAPDEDIRDIRGPQFAVPWLFPALIAGGAALALGGYGVWRWRRRRPRPRVLLPFEAALQRLEGIRSLMQLTTAREFSIAVSDIVRGYIEQGFELTATHRTTEEFLRDLLESSNAALVRHRALLSEFLHQCDLAKFAGMSLTLQNMESLHHSACDFVRATADKTHDSLPAT